MDSRTVIDDRNRSSRDHSLVLISDSACEGCVGRLRLERVVNRRHLDIIPKTKRNYHRQGCRKAKLPQARLQKKEKTRNFPV